MPNTDLDNLAEIEKVTPGTRETQTRGTTLRLLTGIARVALPIAVLGCGGSVPETAQPGASQEATQPPGPVGTDPPVSASPTALATMTVSSAAPSVASAPTTSGSPTFGPPDSAYLRDITTRATFSVVIEARNAQSGVVALAIPKLGLLWTTSSATLDSDEDGSIRVAYRGLGNLDRNARLDLDYGVAVLSSGLSDEVPITISATIGPDLRTGTVAVTVADQRYTIIDRAPTESAQATTDALAAATRKQDWRAWYGLLSSTVARVITEEELVARMQAGVEPYGRVVNASVGGLTYRRDAYLDIAEAPFTITVEKEGAMREMAYTVVLVWEGPGWRLATTTPPPSP